MVKNMRYEEEYNMFLCVTAIIGVLCGRVLSVMLVLASCRKCLTYGIVGFSAQNQWSVSSTA